MSVTNGVLTQSQRDLLKAMLNRIIPSEGQFPGAGDLGVADFVEAAIGQDTQLRRLFLEGLAQAEIAVARRESKGFDELSDRAKDDALRHVHGEQPKFFEALLVQAYSGYYTNPRIFQLIGYTLPQVYEPKPFDEGLLAKQRRRSSFWRQV